jgi:carboxyl-terminal processing protease
MIRLCYTLVLAVLVAACGGGGGSSRAAVAPVPAPTPPATGFEAGEFEPASNFKDLCVAPRTGNFPDAQGSRTDENNWLRSWSNELYLWYDEIQDENPEDFGTADYFGLLKSFETTTSGAFRDRFHFTFDTEEWIALSQSGVSAGYGVRFAVTEALPPREIVVVMREGDGASPAGLADLSRGANILSVDGVDVEFGDDVDTLDNGLFPQDLGETHDFMVQDLGSANTRTITMTSSEITFDPVQFVRTIDTDSGKVGYLFFSRHIATSEAELIDAMQFLANEGVTDLIVDLRYNGGGFVDIANQFAFMIAGPAAADGRIFHEVQFNDKHPVQNPVTGAALSPEFFIETSLGFSAPEGEPLPVLNLARVYVLTGAGTCSASELIVNGLRGIGIEVIQIGETTCGKPYGFYAFDNCGTTYFSIQFQGVNSLGFGDYSDGFSPANVSLPAGVELPGCEIADDYDHALSDDAEARTAAALEYRENGACPVQTNSSPSGLRFAKARQGKPLIAPQFPGSVKRR